jgi:hypothetical protein
MTMLRIARCVNKEGGTRRRGGRGGGDGVKRLSRKLNFEDFFEAREVAGAVAGHEGNVLEADAAA